MKSAIASRSSTACGVHLTSAIWLSFPSPQHALLSGLHLPASGLFRSLPGTEDAPWHLQSWHQGEVLQLCEQFFLRTRFVSINFSVFRLWFRRKTFQYTSIFFWIGDKGRSLERCLLTPNSISTSSKSPITIKFTRYHAQTGRSGRKKKD